MITTKTLVLLEASSDTTLLLEWSYTDGRANVTEQRRYSTNRALAEAVQETMPILESRDELPVHSTMLGDPGVMSVNGKRPD